MGFYKEAANSTMNNINKEKSLIVSAVGGVKALTNSQARQKALSNLEDDLSAIKEQLGGMKTTLKVGDEDGKE